MVKQLTMNVLNERIRENRHTIEFINNLLETEPTLTKKDRERLEAKKQRCEIEIKNALLQIKK